MGIITVVREHASRGLRLGETRGRREDVPAKRTTQVDERVFAVVTLDPLLEERRERRHLHALVVIGHTTAIREVKRLCHGRSGSKASSCE